MYFANEEQNMGSIKGEQDVLKLVYPGRYVEIHKEPITAAEALKKYPRHSVTRPDVFEYPWILVRPESVLNIGRVFYIVPNLTIYKLIKAKGYSIQPSLQRNQSPQSYVQRQHIERSSSAGGTPKHNDHCQSHWKQFSDTCLEEASLLLQEQAGARFESLADMMTKYQSTYKEFKQMSVTDSVSDIESVRDEKYCFRKVSSSSKAAALKQNGGIGTQSLKQVTILKPCLRKHNSARKFLHLKVSFFLDTECEERKRKATESKAESPEIFTC